MTAYTVRPDVRTYLIKAYQQSILRGLLSTDRLYYRVRRRNGDRWLYRVYADDHGCPMITLTAYTAAQLAEVSMEPTVPIIDDVIVWPREKEATHE